VVGWQRLLQEKGQEISTAETAASYKRAELAKANELQSALDALDKARQVADQQPADEKAAVALAQAQADV